MSTPARPYISGGQVLDSPPLSARLRFFSNQAYVFLGLYFTTLLSVDPYSAAQSSPFNISGNRSTSSSSSSSKNQQGAKRGRGMDFFGGGGGGGGGGGRKPPPGGGSGGGGRRIGTVDDVRAPECGSCQ